MMITVNERLNRTIHDSRMFIPAVFCSFACKFPWEHCVVDQRTGLYQPEDFVRVKNPSELCDELLTFEPYRLALKNRRTGQVAVDWPEPGAFEHMYDVIWDIVGSERYHAEDELVAPPSEDPGLFEK